MRFSPTGAFGDVCVLRLERDETVPMQGARVWPLIAASVDGTVYVDVDGTAYEIDQDRAHPRSGFVGVSDCGGFAIFAPVESPLDTAEVAVTHRSRLAWLGADVQDVDVSVDVMVEILCTLAAERGIDWALQTAERAICDLDWAPRARTAMLRAVAERSAQWWSDEADRWREWVADGSATAGELAAVEYRAAVEEWRLL